MWEGAWRRPSRGWSCRIRASLGSLTVRGTGGPSFRYKKASIDGNWAVCGMSFYFSGFFFFAFYFLRW
jgi:hypothetical protein